MAEMRELIRALGSGGRTVIVSSHLMVEVEQVCDRAAVIAKGKLVAQGTIDELRGDDVLVIQADPLEEAQQLVAGITGVREVRAGNGEIRVLGYGRGMLDPARINARLVREGIEVRELRPERASLESVFLSLTNGHADVSREDGEADPAESSQEMEVRYAS
jgi:ABC-2 type transport system ATP-binding protein